MLHHHGNETERLSVEQDATGAVTPTVSNFLDVQYSELNSTVTPVGRRHNNIIGALGNNDLNEANKYI